MARTIDVQKVINLRKARFSWREVSDAIGVKYNTMYTWLLKQGRCYYLKINPIPYVFKLSYNHILLGGVIKPINIHDLHNNRTNDKV